MNSKSEKQYANLCKLFYSNALNTMFGRWTHLRVQYSPTDDSAPWKRVRRHCHSRQRAHIAPAGIQPVSDPAHARYSPHIVAFVVDTRLASNDTCRTSNSKVSGTIIESGQQHLCATSVTVFICDLVLNIHQNTHRQDI